MQSDTWVFPDILWNPTKIYGPKVFRFTKIKPEYSDILYNPTHFPGPLACRIRQVSLYIYVRVIIVIVNSIVHLKYWQRAVFPTVNWSWMDIRSSKGVRITGPSIKFTGHSHTPLRCSDCYWSFGPVMNNLLLDQTNFYWTLPHVRWTLGITERADISSTGPVCIKLLKLRFSLENI
jgi:hypothetical protein